MSSYTVSVEPRQPIGLRDGIVLNSRQVKCLCVSVCTYSMYSTASSAPVCLHLKVCDARVCEHQCGLFRTRQWESVEQTETHEKEKKSKQQKQNKNRLSGQSRIEIIVSCVSVVVLPQITRSDDVRLKVEETGRGGVMWWRSDWSVR